IVATANPVTYSITYSDNSGDLSIANLPSVQASSLNAQSKLNTSTISLSSTIPTRTGYTFNKWCLGTVSNSGTTCSVDLSDPTNRPGTLYSSGADFGIDQTTDNSNITLYATWTINQYACTKRYRLQNADGSFPTSYTADGTEQVNFGATCTYAKTITDYKSSASATNSTAVSTSGTMTTSGITLSLDFYRDTYALTINRNTTYISSVSGADTYRWGQSVSISASPATNSKFTTWSQTSGTTSSFASATTATTTFTMPKSAATIYADGEATKPYIQDFTLAQCQSRASSGNVTVVDKRDSKEYTVRYIYDACYMTKNLAFAESDLYSTTSNVNSNKTLTWYAYNTNYCNGNEYSSSMTNTCMVLSDQYGGYYNYSGATAGTIVGISYTGNNPTQDICPKNWHLPSYNTRPGAFADIYNKVSEFSPENGGYYGVGQFYSQPSLWWTSSLATENRFYTPFYYTGNSSIGMNDGSDNPSRRFWLNSVRCVRTS
ncbi:hypothetical protein IJ135_01875, partial [Candidatus Saccharibacteria bacterium]|nr:hypothetical protein [Candidatus Saccharibacteria bacterium]